MEIRLARPDEAKLLGSALPDALVDDPAFRWLFRRVRDAISGCSRSSVMSSYLQTGKPAYRADDDAAAALWSDPGTNSRLQFDLN